MGKLDGKVALVTGGNSGIGLATAKHFVHEGAYVFITGRRGAELAAAVKEIGRNVTAVQGDVSNVAAVERLFAQIKQEKGKLDIVFANAGVVRYAALGAISEELFDSIFDTNVKGVLFTVQKALPLLDLHNFAHVDETGRATVYPQVYVDDQARPGKVSRCWWIGSLGGG